MSSLLAQVVAQLKFAVDQLDGLAVRANHAAEDIAQGHDRCAGVGSGSSHPALRAAIGQSRAAVDKTRTVSRLVAAAAGHLGEYAREIAPGSIGAPSDHAMPSGEIVVSESASRGSKAEAFLRRHVKKADSTEESLQKAEKAVTAGLRDLIDQAKSGPGSTTTSTAQPTPATPTERPQLDHPVTSVIMTAGAVLVGVKGLWNLAKKNHKRRRHGDQS
ncbi:hypothetical protein [Micromonospora sp. SH-82]|uniref:hypothetical protein n=1 Tax=Micromonospora sp. SH-82 TaxID=3132938 RepID=UPI003EB783E4